MVAAAAGLAAAAAGSGAAAVGLGGVAVALTARRWVPNTLLPFKPPII